MSTPLFRIERTRNRSSRAVLKDDHIVIRLARGLPAAEERRHIDILLRRMAKAQAKEAKRVTIDPFRPLLEGAGELMLTLSTGSVAMIRVAPGPRTKAKYQDGIWHIERSATSDERRFHRFLWRVLCSDAAADIDTLVRTINTQTFGSPIKKVSLKFMRSRWGSCSTDGNISLAAPLLCTDAGILRYVIIHELAHTLHPDHSARFWSAVATHDADYREDLLRLRGMRMPRLQNN
jgi:predicted metal-dependent hydrolase